MRELKFRYTLKRKRDGHIYQVIMPLEAIEELSQPSHFLPLNSELWEVIAKDEFTGLHDKNGVDIYEGDVVTYKFNEIGEVVEDIRRDCFVTNSPLYDGVTGYSENTAEVIGNIHENPELVSGRG